MWKIMSEEDHLNQLILWLPKRKSQKWKGPLFHLLTLVSRQNVYPSQESDRLHRTRLTRLTVVVKEVFEMLINNDVTFDPDEDTVSLPHARQGKVSVEEPHKNERTVDSKQLVAPFEKLTSA